MILILVVAVYRQILSSTEQGFIGLLRGTKHSCLGGGSCNFQPCFRGGSVNFVPKGGGGPGVFYQPHFQMSLLPSPPSIFFDQFLVNKGNTLPEKDVPSRIF